MKREYSNDYDPVGPVAAGLTRKAKVGHRSVAEVMPPGSSFVANMTHNRSLNTHDIAGARPRQPMGAVCFPLQTSLNAPTGKSEPPLEACWLEVRARGAFSLWFEIRPRRV